MNLKEYPQDTSMELFGGSGVAFLDEEQYSLLNKETLQRVLKITHFSKSWAKDSESNVLFSQIAIPPLGESSYEIWLGKERSPIVNKVENNIEFSESKEKTFIRIEVAESETVNLEKAGYEIYIQIFELMQSGRLGNFVRAWNYIPKILSVDGDLERYRRFNVGRWNAWYDKGPKFSNGLPMRPAMTGIGSFDGPLVVEAMFSPYEVRYMENPRQKQFIHYSEKWGPKPPVSARGTLHLPPEGPEVYIAGTASLVGEDVAHEGDIVAQTSETLKNIETLIAKENMNNYGQDFGFDLKDVDGIRVYIKNPEDFREVKQVLDQFWKDKKVLYLNDEICRPGFLLEIEGVARKYPVN
jgi:enamine deaminase RidA (YjgF/YER057c/UK114 family)